MARLQHYVNRELPYVQVGFRKGRGTIGQIVNICKTNIEKAKDSRKTSTSASLTTLKPLTVWITTSCGKFLKNWEYQTTWPASWDICMQVKKQQLDLDMEQKMVPKRERSSQGYILSPCLLNLYSCTSCKMLDWMKHKLESRLPGEVSITTDMQMTPPLWEKAKRN